MTDLDRLLELYELQKHSLGEKENIEFESLKDTIQGQIENGEKCSKNGAYELVKKGEMETMMNIAEALESQITKLKEELNNNHLTFIELREERLTTKSVIDEIKVLTEIRVSEGDGLDLSNELKSILDKLESK